MPDFLEQTGNHFIDISAKYFNTAREDEKNLALISVNLSLFKAFANTYCQSIKSFISDNEIESLMPGSIVITYEQAIRFATDYLNGDIYYRTKYDRHNLVRTRTQIAYLIDLKANFLEMDNYVRGLFI